MSLQTDLIFVRALRNNAELIGMLPAGDVYNTAIALPETDAMNAPLPYIIVSYDGMNNESSTKDSVYEGLTDQVLIGIEIAAETRRQLAQIAIMVRKTVRGFLSGLSDDDEDFPLVPSDIQLSAKNVQYDEYKPCYWQMLCYNCDTNID